MTFNSQLVASLSTLTSLWLRGELLRVSRETRCRFDIDLECTDGRMLFLSTWRLVFIGARVLRIPLSFQSSVCSFPLNGKVVEEGGPCRRRRAWFGAKFRACARALESAQHTNRFG